jgi:hypothetical protein
MLIRPPFRSRPRTAARAQGADDFLPVLVLVLLRAAPPQLASNLAYIARFRLASRLVSETSYFYTNLVSAAVRAHAPFRACAWTAQQHGVMRTVCLRAARASCARHDAPQTFLELAEPRQFKGVDADEFTSRLRALVRRLCLSLSRALACWRAA